MKTTYNILLISHILLVFLIGLWLFAQGRHEIKKIPKGFISLCLLTLFLSLVMMQLNMMQHSDDPTIELLNPYKYGVKTAAFGALIVIAMTHYKKPAISQRIWQVLIALMAFDLIISGVWM